MADKVLLALLSAAVGALLGGVVSALVARYASFKESYELAGPRAPLLSQMQALKEGRDYGAKELAGHDRR